jgi:calcium-translocating P-type ATPase
MGGLVVDADTQRAGAGSALLARGPSPRGLTAIEVAARRAEHGPNELPRPRPRRLWRRFLAQFTDLFAVVLQAAAGITFLAYLLSSPADVGSLQLTVAILGVVVLNAAIGFGQEYSAERSAEALRAMVPHLCRVIRDGERTEVPVRDVVPGDVVLLEAGDAVPADATVVEAHDLTVNMAALTGESEPVRVDRVHLGTTVTSGSGKAVVFATGAGTEFGRICQLTQDAPESRTPLQLQVASMARRVSAVALSVGAAMFIIRAPSDAPLVASFVFALGVMVALVPEGLPATLSVSLAIGVRRMARRQALVKRLLAVEALGSTTVICTDKTGTLTKAEMTVTEVWVGGTSHAVSGVGYAPAGQITGATSAVDPLRAAALCSNARLVPPADKEGWRVLGDTTEGALIVAAAKAGLDLDQEQSRWPRTAEFPFDPVRKLMTTVHRGRDGYVAYVKGAPQEVLDRCAATSWSGRLTAAERDVVGAANEAMAASGLRVLAVARRTVTGARPAQHEAESGLTLLGLVGMTDPPRPEVADAVRACRRGHIRIVVVTGDHPLTAEAVARRVGIVTEPPLVVLGSTVDAMSDDDLEATLVSPRPLLFCRVSPEHKMRVVSALQRRGEVVAVTGDGANDAPALKRADIGVAMGASGTDVARESADMVLLDDSFASIAAAVELGRSVYQNIRKFLIYLFSHNIGELVPILVASLVGFPLVPLLAVQVLAIDLGSDVLPALALGAEPPEPGTMDAPPRSRREKLLSAPVMRRILFLGGIQAVGVSIVFFWHIHASGIPFDAFTPDNPVYREAITLTQAGIVVCQLFNSLACRTDRQSIFSVGVFSNPRILAAGAIGLLIMAAISYLPSLQAIFHTAPLQPADWAVLFGLGALLLAAEEARKWWHRRRAEPAPQKGEPR